MKLIQLIDNALFSRNVPPCSDYTLATVATALLTTRIVESCGIFITKRYILPVFFETLRSFRTLSRKCDPTTPSKGEIHNKIRIPDGLWLSFLATGKEDCQFFGVRLRGILTHFVGLNEFRTRSIEEWGEGLHPPLNRLLKPL